MYRHSQSLSELAPDLAREFPPGMCRLTFWSVFSLLAFTAAPHNVRVSGLASVYVGSGFTLTCEAEGSPVPAFTWMALKPDGQRVEIEKHQELVVRNASLTDAGTYQCEVSNRLGRKTANVSVVVQG